MHLKKVQETRNWYFTYIIRYGVYMSVMCISDLYSRVLNPLSVLANLSKQGSRRWETLIGFTSDSDQKSGTFGEVKEI
jgi:hypothetical protein